MNTNNSHSSTHIKTEFNAEEWQRYARHVQLPKFGAAGQSKLKSSKVLIVGSGGLGSPVSLYLAAAGVGTLTLIDHDRVDVSNLQRQILFDSQSVGLKKADAGAKRLQALNPHINVIADSRRFEQDIAEELIKEHDLILDCTDNFATRYLINDLCHTLNKPWIFASIYQFSGQCAVFTPGQGCFRCLFPDYPENVDDCNAAGVIGVLPGLLGTLQANEALKFLAGITSPLVGALLLVDALQLSFRQIKLAASPSCSCCGNGTNELEKDYAIPSCAVESNPLEINAEEFKQKIQLEAVQLIDVRSNTEHKAFNIGGTNIDQSQFEPKGITNAKLDPNRAILLYCQSGMRSLKVAQQLEQQGFQVRSLKGGLMAWLKAPDKE